MPYFKVTLKLQNHALQQGIRYTDTNDIDIAWTFFFNLVMRRYSEGALEFFDCVMVSKYSDEFQAHLKKHGRRLSTPVNDADVKLDVVRGGLSSGERR